MSLVGGSRMENPSISKLKGASPVGITNPDRVWITEPDRFALAPYPCVKLVAVEFVDRSSR